MQCVITIGVVFTVIALGLIASALVQTITQSKTLKNFILNTKEQHYINSKQRKVRRAANLAEQKRKRDALRDASYIEAMHSISLATAPTPEKVDISVVIKKAKPPIKFKLSFWAAKQKVCKPFAK